MKRKLIALLIAAAMSVTMNVPAALCYGASEEGDSSEPAVLDGEELDDMTQEELDEDSVMGSDLQEEMEEYQEEEEAAEGDGSMTIMSTAKAWATKTKGSAYYNGKGTALLSGAVAKGIDVSKHQGTINWSKAKADGVEFAIIRLGYGSNYTSQDDAKLSYNVQQCEKYGIPYGFYLYSYANTSTKNNSEINHVLRLLKGTNPTYPVYYDLEDSGTTGKCSYATIRSYALNYCKKIKAAGYTPGVYASLSWFNSKLATSDLDAYERWVAQWTKLGCTYGRSWKLWQCADDYYVNGISGKVDLNFAYKKFTSSGTTPTTTTTTTTTSSSSSRTTGWVTKSGKKYYYNSSGTLQKSKWFKVSGKYYYATSTGAIYQGVYKKIGNYYYGFSSSGVRYTSQTAKIGGKHYYFNSAGKAYLCKAKTTARLNKRTGPGTNYASKGLYKKGTTVRILRKNGDWWWTTNGVWVHKKYLKVTKKYPY